VMLDEGLAYPRNRRFLVHERVDEVWRRLGEAGH